MFRERIPYETLVQDALRNVIAQVLERVAANGLPGDHHFYITFHTNIAGVELSARLRERYPDHVTIVLQNQFWDLVVGEDYFSVTLSFNDIPERLVIPFMAVRAFYDPVAPFEASFDIVGQIPPISQETGAFMPQIVQAGGQENASVSMLPGIKKKDSPAQLREKSQEPNHNATQDSTDEKSADVVSLDAFRKK